MKIKVGDTVQFIAGKSRHSKKNTGKVLKIDKKNNKVIVEGHNIRKKFIKKTTNEPGRIIEFEAPVDASNVMVVCPKTNKPTRVGYIITKDKKKERIAKVSGESLDSKANVKVKSK